MSHTKADISYRLSFPPFSNFNPNMLLSWTFKGTAEQFLCSTLSSCTVLPHFTIVSLRLNNSRSLCHIKVNETWVKKRWDCRSPQSQKCHRTWWLKCGNNGTQRGRGRKWIINLPVVFLEHLSSVTSHRGGNALWQNVRQREGKNEMEKKINNYCLGWACCLVRAWIQY